MAKMDKKAFESATGKVSVALEKAAAMKLATEASALARLWEEFLTVQQQVFLRLKKAFEHGASKQLSDAIVNDQRSDDMLKYVLHARNADEHGVDAVSETVQPRLSINPKAGGELRVNHLVLDSRRSFPVVTMDKETAENVVIAFHPAEVYLIRVRDRGVYYDPPTKHLGRSITPTPIVVADLLTKYLATRIAQGKSYL